MAYINSYYPLLDLDTTQKGTTSNSQYYREVRTQGYVGLDDINIIRRGGGAYKIKVIL